MKCFNQIRKECFGVDLDQNYKLSIRKFAYLWLKCDRSITLKCHILFVHVVQFLGFQENKFPNKGLGFWAEQASEGSHHKFDQHHEGYKRQLDAPDHDLKLFDSGAAFNEKAFGF